VKKEKVERINIGNKESKKQDTQCTAKSYYLYINKIQQDATVCRYLFAAKLLYMFRVSIAPIIMST